MNEKRWRQLGGGDFYKFETPGQTLEGVWQGTTTGKFAENGVVIDGSGQKLMFTLNAALKDLIGVRPGTSIRVEYTGKQTAKKSGNEFKAFNVFVMDNGDNPQEAPDDDVPF